ncbi:MAG: 3-oxoacyl-ACP reductase [Acidobacteria bacterium]|nr:MAG: 3-oxoacyl-ACP reductase [Acidobacteriota bacterium]
MGDQRPWCFILGASSGMGEACARQLHAEGMNVYGLHLDPSSAQPRLDQLMADISGNGIRCRLVNANAAKSSVREAVVGELKELAGGGQGVAVVVHSLAFGALGPLVADGGGPPISASQLEMTLNVMANSLVYWVQDLYRSGLLGRGSKVFALTSAGSSKVAASYGAVSAAKAALEAYVRQLAFELARSGVAVNAIRAGVTLTPALRKIPGHERIVQRAREINPHGRLTTPEDVAQAIALMCRAPSTWITGNVIGVDGGEYFSS